MREDTTKRPLAPESPGEDRKTQLERSSLGPLLGALLEGLRPLGPVAAQLVWLGQPLLGVLGQEQAALGLAERLDQAGNRQGAEGGEVTGWTE